LFRRRADLSGTQRSDQRVHVGAGPGQISRRRANARSDRKSTRLNSSHANIYTLSLHDALPISISTTSRSFWDATVGSACSRRSGPWPDISPTSKRTIRSEEHTSELQSRQYLHSFPTRRSSDLYFDDEPIFLGRNGRISVFTSERALARYLADEQTHDLSELSTYDDIRTAAMDGSLEANVTEENIYVLTGLADDLSRGPDAVDEEQLDLAVELLRDVGEYAEDNTVEKALSTESQLGQLVAYIL